jgi:hypothetical protein
MASSGSNYNYGYWIFYLQMVYEERAASVTTRKKIKDVVMDGNGHLIREYRTLFTLQC